MRSLYYTRYVVKHGARLARAAVSLQKRASRPAHSECPPICGAQLRTLSLVAACRKAGAWSVLRILLAIEDGASSDSARNGRPSQWAWRVGALARGAAWEFRISELPGNDACIGGSGVWELTRNRARFRWDLRRAPALGARSSEFCSESTTLSVI